MLFITPSPPHPVPILSWEGPVQLYCLSSSPLWISTFEKLCGGVVKVIGRGQGQELDNIFDKLVGTCVYQISIASWQSPPVSD